MGRAMQFKSESAPESDSEMKALMAAVEKGVQNKNGIYRFFDPGIPLDVLNDLSVIQEQDLFYWTKDRLDQSFPRIDRFDQYDWGMCKDVPQERILRFPMKGSFNKTFPNQKKLLLPDEEVPSTRIVCRFLVINALATGKRLLRKSYVRCVDQNSIGDLTLVGGFDANGIDIDFCSGDLKSSEIGLIALRKS